VVVVGSGLAGLATALCLQPLPVLLVTEGSLGQSGSTRRAQGGIACAMGDDDRPRDHAEDTIAAGGGLADQDIVESVVAAAPGCIELLRDWGVPFDEGPNGAPALTLEGAHRRRRILHAGGDRTGAALAQALLEKVRATPSIDVIERASVIKLVVGDVQMNGVLVRRSSSITPIAARAVVLATGGTGGLYASTTNPLGNWGAGLRLAAHAGAVLRDLEFVQFHPTGIDLPSAAASGAPLPLASEAIRGEGGVLVDDAGAPVMRAAQGGNLASRDRLARTIWDRLSAGGQVFLDARDALGSRFPQRFPMVTALCRAGGIDPVTQPIPVRPAAHYHMGGVGTDDAGATNVSGLWAVGDVASTRMHGANRLASNSLLEAIAFATFAARDIRSRSHRRPMLDRFPSPSPDATSFYDAPGERAPALRLRRLMDRHVGVERDQHGLEIAIEALSHLRAGSGASGRLAGMAEVAEMITRAALRRQETRGAHARSDFPTVADPPLQQSVRLADIHTGRLEFSWSE